MARPNHPTALHEIKGSYTKNPQRRKRGEPRPKGGIGPAPDWMPEAERKIWDELVGIVPPGVLGDSDRWAVERAVRLMYLARYEPDEFSGNREGHLLSYLSRMGLTPSDRSKITVTGTDDKENPAEKFF